MEESKDCEVKSEKHPVPYKKRILRKHTNSQSDDKRFNKLFISCWILEGCWGRKSAYFCFCVTLWCTMHDHIQVWSWFIYVQTQLVLKHREISNCLFNILKTLCSLHDNSMIMVDLKGKRNFTVVTVRNEVWGKVMFLRLSVSHSIHRGGWLPSMHHRSHDWGRLHLGGGCLHLVGMLGRPPEHYKIWSISGRYAAYWNAFLLPPAKKFGQGYVFTCVCYSVHRGWGVGGSQHALQVVSQHALQQVSRGVVSQHALQVVCQHALQVSRGVSRPTPGGYPSMLWDRPPWTATAAGGTHPTGMHSCLEYIHLRPFSFSESDATDVIKDLIQSLNSVNTENRTLRVGASCWRASRAKFAVSD